ncbi:hypothetical protein U1P98_01135 [Lysinibacillus irui]|uniref:Uncharacterized protein n=1 Tax=Lysinibacillus irui TaxID=2998077 RepID=A0ABU5NFS3_9BACI|nr:hypothetical protein [Lysinibacillus irui]MEA0554176.1 hypothetical protein [Lysinibacillus irui]MEA0974882.1 hypothetical protein [Lysinibacillus irui]MEA1041036.1 hypothetical protein [Lysinibacillus irui]
MLRKKRDLSDIRKEMDQVKFKVHQYTQDLKVLRGKRNDLENEQGKETMHTSIEETVERVQLLKDFNDQILLAEKELDACLVEQNKLDDEVVSIIEAIKVIRNEELVQFDKEVSRVEKLTNQLQIEVDKLAVQRRKIIKNNQSILGIAENYLNKTKAQEITAKEYDQNCGNQARQIRNLLVKKAGHEWDTIA